MKRTTTKTSATTHKKVAMGSFAAMNCRNFGSC